MKRMLKNGLILLLVLCAALIFSLQLRWLSRKGASRYNERMAQMHVVITLPVRSDEPAEGEKWTDIDEDITDGLLTRY
ncbi:MAG: hypothetical protein LIO51_06440 [Clostridiales bacterium]|nr:hypothetical protein [Clostridiales bacterium]